MIFTTRSRTGLGIGLLVSGLLLIDSSDNRLVLAILGLLLMALGAFQIVRAYQIRDTEDKPDDPFASPTDGPSGAGS